MGSLLELRDVHHRHGRGAGAVTALGGVTVGVVPGRLTAVIGPSGAGKSTLPRIAARLDLPLRLAGVRPGGWRIRAAITEVDLADRLRHRPGGLSGRLSGGLSGGLSGRFSGGLSGRFSGGLSGGEWQRAAIARTLVIRSALPFADEPTGTLDPGAGRAILALLREAVDRHGQTILPATHDPAVADSVITLVDGRVVPSSGLPVRPMPSDLSGPPGRDRVGGVAA